MTMQEMERPEWRAQSTLAYEKPCSGENQEAVMTTLAKRGLAC